MIKEVIKKLFASFGYEVRNVRLDKNIGLRQGYYIYDYLNDDGSFNYERYRAIQLEGNRNKIENIWVLESNIAWLSEYIKKHSLNTVEFGICHGTRRGKEQEWFRKYLDCEVIGTEISDTAMRFPYTIQWDFHEAKSEWINKVDFIYSNSFDHSYDPEKCLNTWMSCIKPGGICILEHSNLHGLDGVCELDPFGADITVMPYLIAIWAKGRYFICEILNAPDKIEGVKSLSFIVIQKL